MQYTKLGSVLEMIPETVGKGRSVTGLAFSSDGSTLALGGASAAIKLHNYEAVLAGGTRCAHFGQGLGRAYPIVTSAISTSGAHANVWSDAV